MIKNMLTRRKESDTYLATVSRQITMKIDKLELSASTVAFSSCRGRLFQPADQGHSAD